MTPLLALALIAPASSAEPDWRHLAHTAWELGDVALDHIGATPDQRRELAQAARATKRALSSHKSTVVAVLREAEDVFVADRVERASVEAVRVAAVEAVDDMSAELVDLVVVAGHTLTPAQRAELVELAREEARAQLTR